MNTYRATTFRTCIFYCLVVICMTIISCSPEDYDKQIKIDITSKAKSDINFAGVNYIVKNGGVILTGSCPTVKARAGVDQSLSTIHILKFVDNRIKISPVTMGASFAIKQAVDSVLATYPLVNAEVTDSAVVLIGSVKGPESAKLLSDIKKVASGTLVNNMTIN